MCARRGCPDIGQPTDQKRCEACGFVTVRYNAEKAAILLNQQTASTGRVSSFPVAAPDSVLPDELTFVLTGRGGMAQKIVLRFFSAMVWVLALATLSAGHRAWGSIPFFLWAAAMTWVIETRVLRVSVTATRDGLTVRNYWRTKKIAWDQIVGFEITYRSGLSCELSDGKRVAMKGIAQGLFGDPAPQKEAVALIESYRDGVHTNSPSHA